MKRIALFPGTALAVFCAFSSGNADAAWQIVQANGCSIETSHYLLVGGEPFAFGGDFYASCALLESATATNSRTKADVAQVNIHVRDDDNAGEAIARACIEYADGHDSFVGPGGTCGNAVHTSLTGTGDVMLNPPLDAWHNPAYLWDFAYLYVFTPYKDSGFTPVIMSPFRGYSVLY